MPLLGGLGDRRLGQEPALHFQSGLAARRGGRHCLAVAEVVGVAGHEHPFHVGALAVIGFDVTLLVQLHLPGEQLGVGLVADGHEHGLGGNLAGLPRLHVADADAGDGLVPQDLLHYRVPDEADLGIGHGPVLHDLAGPELVPAMDYGNAPADVAQEQSLFHGGVAAAHHHHVPVSEEEAVAGGAAGYAAAHQPAFGFKAEPLGLGAGGDDDGLGQVGVVAHFY